MKKNCFILSLTPIFLLSCNPAKVFNVNFVSDTLTIDNLVAKENTDYEATIDFKEENYNYRLPNNVTVYVGKKRINEDQYTFDNVTGRLLVSGNTINDDLRIVAERRVIDGCQINFETDEHIHFYFYPNRNYTVVPVEDTIAIARDLTGKPVMDGTGEINFKYTVDDDYDTNQFWIQGMCDEMQEVESGIYRITNIKNDIRVCTSTKKIYCKNLCASANYNTPSFTFSWETKNPEKVNRVKIEIIHNGEMVTDSTPHSTYTYSNNVIVEDLYKFVFTPILTDGTEGGSIEKDMMLSPASKIGFPRVEITTKNDRLPPYEVAYSPGGLNVTAINNNYIQNIIKIYDDQGIEKYDSSGGDSTYFEGSKIKVRGNTSTIYSNGKESYKIKLNDKADLLDPFLNRSTTLGGDAYHDKEWLLLNCGNQINELGGFSIEKSLGMPWIPQCQYVTLFMNNDFKGIYILCEAITKGNKSETEPSVQSRCPIDEDGFIIENDAYGWTENLTFKTRLNQLVNQMEYTFKYPDADKLSYESAQYQYIDKYVKDFEARFYTSPVDQDYIQYIDVDSFARWTVAHDLMHVEDYIGSNMYIYKKDSKESKLIAGTTWDFDSAFIGNEDPSHPKGLCYHRSSPFYYIRIFKNIDEFKTDTQSIFNTAKGSIISDFEEYIRYISDKEDIYDTLLDKEAKRFGKQQVYFDSQKNQIKHYLTVQIKYINEHPYTNN